MMLINRITLLVNMANKRNMCCLSEQSEIGQCIQCQQSHNYLTGINNHLFEVSVVTCYVRLETPLQCLYRGGAAGNDPRTTAVETVA